MSNVIEFLEFAGRAGLRADSKALAEQLDQFKTAPLLHQALLSGEQNALAAVLGARSNVTLGLFPADDEDSKGGGKDDDELRIAC
jgi:hypothetical protein